MRGRAGSGADLWSDMATYYVGIGGNDGSAGTSWAARKLTLNGAEDIPVAAGDTVYVGPGTYRELLTCDVSGGAGSAITYIGDYDGTHTNGIGGVVRVTGSDDDQTITRTNCILSNTKNYRTFTGFVFDMSSSSLVSTANTTTTNWTITKCLFVPTANTQCIRAEGAGATWLVDSCVFMPTGGSSGHACYFVHSSTFDTSGHIVQNCLFLGGNGNHVRTDRVGGIIVKNCTSLFCGNAAYRVVTALSVGQTLTVNNCVIAYNVTGVQCTTAAELVEDYNTFSANGTDRTTAGAGANSLAYPPLFDSRWFFELVSGKGRMLSPFDLSSYSQLIGVAGTSPTTTDMRGTGTVGAQREWGALEADPTLLYRRVIARE